MPEDEKPIAKRTTKVVRYTSHRVESDNLDDAPEEIRKLMQDKDGDGVPDALQQKGASLEQRVSYEFNGRKYSSLEEMPPKVRAFFEGKAQVAGGVIQSAEPPLAPSRNWAAEETRVMPPPAEDADEPTVTVTYKPKPQSSAFKYVVAAVIAAIVGLVVYFALK